MMGAQKNAQEEGSPTAGSSSGGEGDEAAVPSALLGQVVMLHQFDPPAAKSGAKHEYLKLRKNDIVSLLLKPEDSAGWWLGVCRGAIGWFPARFCVEIAESDAPHQGSEAGTDIPGALSPGSALAI
ncbi:hypothetical protein T484DRAFT_3138394 [Baffinella frigidus]|nr:hypothetical protein T484DRAFT_3138394 [Cryptophyta sp. CCMP2293]